MRPNNTKSYFRCILLVMIAVVILTACNGNKSTSSNETQSLVIAMSASNIPSPDTTPTEGYEGYRFVGHQLYDGLVGWDLTQGEQPADITAGLAESWETSEEDPTIWTFHLRENVTFHDGSPFNADSVVFAFDRISNPDSEFYNASVAGGVLSYLKYVESYEKIDDYTFQIKTTEPYSFLPYDLTFILIPSTEAVKEYGEDYVSHPSGTGPFKFVSMSQGEELVMEKNESYWGEIPKVDQVILKPMPDASSRLAGLQSGQVNWAEIPPTESIDQLKSSGFQVLLNDYPHIWPYLLNLKEEPWNDVRVRQAANYAIDRDALANSLLNGVAKPATQVLYEGHPWYNEEATQYTYDPEKAKELLKEAGYPNGFDTTFVVPTSGSGNMWPLEMNEFVQKNLKEVGINVEIEAIEWQTLITEYRAGFPDDREVGAYNISLAPIAPWVFDRYFATSSFIPNGSNIMEYSNEELDEVIQKARETFDTVERDQYLKEAGKIVADDAPWIFVVHDLNLRVLSENVKGFVQPQSWFADLKTISIE
ncbi:MULTISPECIES: ABC transporter substrate-binding protein [unclassified Bacillus (in: firmicutes)]|uniref:ABC transporter substrate-binding protein n=1 Tax=unclassified Bacillus (in: firmicutes) TaxID=185979 RepID=UPI00068D7626|nr:MULTISPECIES: ABC transporter substrate-binding protein [unclassified Bacillus (in: firmicutes)]CAI9394721.1 Heme-binding protein A [Bacillus sp. T2.9-1]